MSAERPVLDNLDYFSNVTTSLLTNAISNTYERQKDEMFAKKHHQSVSEYNKDDYVRLGFKNKNDMLDFVHSMKLEGVNVVTTTQKYNGQYLLEMEKNPFESNPSITANVLIQNYQNTTFKEIQFAKDEYYDYSTNKNESEKNLPNDIIFNNLIGWQEVFGTYNSIMGWSEQEKYHSDKTKDLFERTPNSMGTINSEVRVGNTSERAIVINNNTVVINGEIVKDENIRNQVLQQHKERIEYVKNDKNFSDTDDIITVARNTSKTNRGISLGVDSINETAQTVCKLEKIQNERMLSKEEMQLLQKSKDTLNDYSKLFGHDFNLKKGTFEPVTRKEFIENNEKVLDILKKQGYDLTARNGVFDTDMFKSIDKNILSNAGITTGIADLIIYTNRNARKLTAKQDLAERIKEHAYKQDYAYESGKVNMDNTTLFCQWSYGSLKDITADLNTENIAIRISVTEKIKEQFSQDEIDIFHETLGKAGISETLLFVTDGESKIISRLDESFRFEMDKLNKKLTSIDRRMEILEKNKKTDTTEYKELLKERKEITEKQYQITNDYNTSKNIVSSIGQLKKDLLDSQITSSKNLKILECITSSDTFENLKIDMNKMEMKDLLSINRAFLEKAGDKGYAFIKADGKFDIKQLQNLTDKDLKVLGINSETKNLLVKINEKGSFGRMESKLTSAGKIGFTVFSVASKLEDDSKDMQELKRDIANVQKLTKYSKNAVKVIRKTGNIKVGDLRKFRSEGFDSIKNAYNRPIKKKPKKPKQKKPLTEKQKKKAEKYLKKQEEKLEKIAKKQNSLRAKASRKIQTAKSKIANSKLGKLQKMMKKFAMKVAKFGIKLLLIWCVVSLVITAFLLIYAVVVTTITSLFDNPTQSVAYKLYEYLEEEEEYWLKDIQNQAIINQKEDLYYTTKYLSYEQYVTPEGEVSFNEFFIHNGELYANPLFTQMTNETLMNTFPDMALKVEAFDGVPQYNIVTNSCIFNEKFNVTEKQYSTIETGHTSNIKDIIAMTDIMYGMGLEENTDDVLYDICGMNVYVLEFQNFIEEVNNFTKMIGNFFIRLGNAITNHFAGEEKFVEFVIEDKYVSYKTLQNYAKHIFTKSHQQVVEFEYFTYDIDKKVYALEGATKTYDSVNKVYDFEGGNYVSIDSSQSRIFGKCDKPAVKTFVLSASITGEADTKQTLKVSPSLAYTQNVGGGATATYIAPFLKIGESSLKTKNPDELVCLKNTFSNNETTFKMLKNYVDSKGNSYSNTSYTTEKPTCWTYTTAQETIKGTSTVSKYDAINKAVNNAKNKYFFIKRLWTDIGKESNDCGFKAYVYPTVTSNPLDWSCVQDASGKWTVTYKTKKTVYQFLRNCKGHEFEYCSGHVALKSTGVVYSAQNEHIGLTGASGNDVVPVVSNFDDIKDSIGYDTFRGKLDESTIDDKTLFSFCTTGKGTDYLTDRQGSVSGIHGMNLYRIDTTTDDDADGDFSEWEKGIFLGNDTQYHLKDIFDVDTSMNFGKNVFPLNSYHGYRGWTSTNMELAVAKLSGDWNDSYEFDIPYEIGASAKDKPLSVDDVDKILEAVKSSYPTISETRLEAVAFALRWVNRLHYAEGHSEHSFLNSLCTSTNSFAVQDTDTGVIYNKYDSGCCTGGTGIDFINFYALHFNKIPSAKTSYATSSLVQTGFTNVLPADIVTHLGRQEVNGKIYLPMIKERLQDLNRQTVNLIKKRYLEEQSIIFIGILNQDVSLSTGQKLMSGVPIYVDLKEDTVGGTTSLHYEPSEDALSGNQKVYYWVDHINPSRTSYFSFE